MARVLSIATHGTDDPTKCTLAFLTAVGAVGAGKEVTIGLVGEGVSVAKAGIAKTIHGVGFPPLPELIDKIIKAQVPVFV